MLVIKRTWLLVHSLCLFPITSRTVTHSRGIDVELGLQSFQSTPTSPETLAHDEVNDSTIPLADHVGEAAEFNYIPELVQGPELQSTFPGLETPQLEDVVASTAPSAGHVGEAAGSGHTPVFIQGLELQSNTPSVETPQRQEVATSTASSAGQAHGVAVSKHTPTSVQGHELQPALSTTVDAATSLSPTLAQEAQIEENGVPKVHNVNAQPALTDMEY